MLRKYSPIIGAAKIVWVIGSPVGVIDGGDEDTMRIAYLPCFAQEAGRHELHLGEEEDDRRHLEHDAHAEQHLGVEPEGVFEPRHERQIHAVEAREKAIMNGNAM